MACDPLKERLKDFDDFEIRVATIKGAEMHPKKEEYVLLLDLGPVERDIQVVADLKKSYKIEELIGQQCVVILNVCSEEVDDVESTGLLLVTMLDEKPRLLQPDKKVLAGVKVYGMMDSMRTHLHEPGKE
jgi:methionyl-tRNA synthetase